MRELPVGDSCVRVENFNTNDNNSVIEHYFQHGPGNLRDTVLNGLLGVSSLGKYGMMLNCLKSWQLRMWCEHALQWRTTYWITVLTIYPKKYAHGFVVLCFVVVMQSYIMNSYEVFIQIHQGCFAGTGAIVRLPQGQWSKPDGYGEISQCITSTKHSKAKTVCMFLGIYCILEVFVQHFHYFPDYML